MKFLRDGSRPPLAALVFLAPLYLAYLGAVKLRRLVYKFGLRASHSLPGTTISIGNLDMGGTGKTPITISLCQYLESQGDKPVILTRGYGSGLPENETLIIQNSHFILKPTHGKTYRPDEAMLQSHFLPKVPIVVGANRIASAKKYLAAYEPPTHWILDDGFQHLRVKRQLDILLLDANAPFQNGYCLPLGRLREPPATCRLADTILLTRAESQIPEKLPNIIPESMPTFRVPFRQKIPKNLENNLLDTAKTYSLLLGIAKPEGVLLNLQALGINIRSRIFKNDHQQFTPAEIEGCLRESDGIITTTKDYFRHPALFAPKEKIYIATIDIELPWEVWRMVLSSGHAADSRT